MLDFHNHMMPGVDDGAGNIDESRSGIRALIDDGVTHIITTPHISASLSGQPLEQYLERVEAGWSDLQGLVASEFPNLQIGRGFEIMLDIPRPVLIDPLHRLGGTQFVLVEFPYMSIPPNSAFALRELRDAGWIPIVAHPERYSNMESAMHLIETWQDAGAYLQLNAGSILGSYGASAKRLAWSILSNGDAHYLCSDYHSRGRCGIASAGAQLRSSGYESQLRTLTMNGDRLLRGDRPLPLEPMLEKPKGGWKKVLPWI